jgi:ABC-type phosphate transport system substrate-binding protein
LNCKSVGAFDCKSVYINGIIGGGDVKLLSIQGVDPASKNIADGSYPLADFFYSVRIKVDEESERAENAGRLIEWILSLQGQKLVKATGYEPSSDSF